MEFLLSSELITGLLEVVWLRFLFIARERDRTALQKMNKWQNTTTCMEESSIKYKLNHSKL